MFTPHALPYPRPLAPTPSLHVCLHTPVNNHPSHPSPSVDDYGSRQPPHHQCWRLRQPPPAPAFTAAVATISHQLPQSHRHRPLSTSPTLSPTHLQPWLHSPSILVPTRSASFFFCFLFFAPQLQCHDNDDRLLGPCQSQLHWLGNSKTPPLII